MLLKRLCSVTSIEVSQYNFGLITLEIIQVSTKQMPLMNQFILEQPYYQGEKQARPLEELLSRKLISNWLHLVILLLLLPMTNSQCYSFSGSTTYESCTICLHQNDFSNCTYNDNSTTPQFNESSCSDHCCSFDINNTIPHCHDTNQSSPHSSSDTNQSLPSSTPSSSDTGTIKLATVLIIIFFTIPASLCICIVIVYCIRRNNNRTFRLHINDVPLSGVNLANFNVDELGPLYQDKAQSCSICLQQKCNIRTKCGHMYHDQCLCDWIHKRQSCPMCVNKDFNPIIVYCNKCYRSIKLVVLMGRMNDHDSQQWGNINQILCEECLGYRSTPTEVSIDISGQIVKNQSESQNKDKVNNSGKVQSHQCKSTV